MQICSFAYSIWLPKWAKYAPNSIFSYMQPIIFPAWVSNFHIHLCFKSSFKNVNLAYLHIQNGHQDGQITFETYSCPSLQFPWTDHHTEYCCSQQFLQTTSWQYSKTTGAHCVLPSFYVLLMQILCKHWVCHQLVTLHVSL